MGGGVSPAIRAGQKAACRRGPRRGQSQCSSRPGATGGRGLGGVDRRADPDPLGRRAARRPTEGDQGPRDPTLAHDDLEQGQGLGRYARSPDPGVPAADRAALRRVSPASRRAGAGASGGAAGEGCRGAKAATRGRGGRDHRRGVDRADRYRRAAAGDADQGKIDRTRLPWPQSARLRNRRPRRLDDPGKGGGGAQRIRYRARRGARPRSEIVCASEGVAMTSLSAREAMERLNAEAGQLNIWLRTQANAPAQRPWFRETGLEASGRLAEGRVGAAQVKPVPHRWRWAQIAPYLDRIAEIARAAEISPIEFAERQQFLLTNPGLGGRLQVTSTMRCAVSIYNPGDVAPVHIHTPNASRTILSDKGGYTTIEGERCEAARGDLILTPNGTWHDHGNDGVEPVVWIDVLDFPLMEFLDCVWLDEAFPGETQSNSRAQRVTLPASYSHKLYAQGGLVPSFVAHRRGFGRDTSPLFHYRGADVREALAGLRQEKGDPYEAVTLRFVNPATGASVFPTLDYRAQLLRPGEATRFKREDRKSTRLNSSHLG